MTPLSHIRQFVDTILGKDLNRSIESSRQTTIKILMLMSPQTPKSYWDSLTNEQHIKELQLIAQNMTRQLNASMEFNEQMKKKVDTLEHGS